jgi:acetolactate synthase-1/2/3 large subunit
MKKRLADYVADFLVSHGVTDCFSVVGGGAMHLNDAFGHKEGLRVTYCHHEQACAIAAEAYARIENRIAVVCVTSGPGGINALNGVAGAWLDSIPMLVISGQVRYDTTARYALQCTGVRLRAMGDQEYDIVKSASPMSKRAVMIEDPKLIRCELERCWHLSTTGRPGPCWIDIPIDFQGADVETDILEGYDHSEYDETLPPAVGDDIIQAVLHKIEKARRPVLYVGNGIRLSGGYGHFIAVVQKLNIPVVTCWNAVDLIEDTNRCYCGRAGSMGDRPGNWAIQNADLILAIGTRISLRQTGYNWKSWASMAKVIMVDIDRSEMAKPSIHVDMPIWADAKDFLGKMEKATFLPIPSKICWLSACLRWKRDYPVVSPRHWDVTSQYVNVYAFIQYLSSNLPESSVSAVSNGACCVVGSQAYVIKKGSRLIINSGSASMGYGLPAAIGVCIGSGRKSVVCLEGDGSVMMNLQELQTIITLKLPIKIFLINNGGYHSIRITQDNFFRNHSKVGIGLESEDLSFPDFKRIALAFGYRYLSANCNIEMMKMVEEAFGIDGAVFCEIFTGCDQVWEPKSIARQMPDGRIDSQPLENLAPFLPQDELDEIMSISKS